jgi:hypothetical protein
VPGVALPQSDVLALGRERSRVPASHLHRPSVAARSSAGLGPLDQLSTNPSATRQQPQPRVPAALATRTSKLAVIASTWFGEPINVKMISRSAAKCSNEPDEPRSSIPRVHRCFQPERLGRPEAFKVPTVTQEGLGRIRTNLRPRRISLVLPFYGHT